MIEDPVPLEELWDRFHRAVNMTSRELAEWLGVTEEISPTPGATDPPSLGLGVLAILRKRRTDLTDDDIEVMRRVIEIIEEETEESAHELLSNERRRHRLLNVGHDPVRGA
ncbi:MAG: DUF3140 domain-containing protein [Streptosporangiales bacterium]